MFKLFAILVTVLVAYVHAAVALAQANYSIELWSGYSFTGHSEHHHDTLSHKIHNSGSVRCSRCMETQSKDIRGKLKSWKYVTGNHFSNDDIQLRFYSDGNCENSYSYFWDGFGPFAIKSMPKDMQGAQSHRVCRYDLCQGDSCPVYT
ncbi:hypothetical protein BJ138DRAFT_576496 [Hygrophoropsis aurantiaca]|uniref:Uncharacterized protein n=1 Tax=Hygrophoropsis aurantiaca TaxID=72124 RepID=A0ACB8A1F9_9AGAM|nr:hypothetical protein BJ138DRAFT_576496 [Hygrophoropsis aurantiaca]